MTSRKWPRSRALRTPCSTAARPETRQRGVRCSRFFLCELCALCVKTNIVITRTAQSNPSHANHEYVLNTEATGITEKKLQQYKPSAQKGYNSAALHSGSEA